MNSMELLQAASNRLHSVMNQEQFDSLGKFFNENPTQLYEFVHGNLRIICKKDRWIITSISVSLPEALISLNNCA